MNKESVSKTDGQPDQNTTKEEDKVTWREFTENTTFHGIKYVFQDSIWLRRLFWIVTILGAVTFFVVQVGLRTRDYLAYQTVTSVRQVSESTLQFPAVTLCNLNQYRISEAAKLGLYGYLNQQLTTKVKIEQENQTMSTKDIVSKLGHQLSQLIDSCEWEGKPCDIEEDFQTQFLDIGLCHTFNYAVTNIKHVNKEGVEGGLKLLLNVEVFEHMRGAHIDSGVKFLLHTPGNIASLRNRGFVATPGQHTFVAIHTSKIKSLPEPWGNCLEHGEPVGDCKHRCLSEEFIEHCYCTDAYMHDWPDYEECDLGTKLTCGCDYNDQDISTCGMNCSCPNPCTETIYKPSLSSAKLSPINLEMFALSEDGEKNATNHNFQEASEIRLRLGPEHNTTFLAPLRSFISAYNSIWLMNQKYDAEVNQSLMSVMLPAGEAFYHSVSELDPVQRHEQNLEALKGEECGKNLLRLGQQIDAILGAAYYVYLQYKAAARDPGFCTTNPGVIGYFLNQSCSSDNQAGRMAEGCTSCPSPASLSNLPLCDVTRMRCVCCHLGNVRHVIKDITAFQVDFQNLERYLSETYRPYGVDVINGIVHRFLDPQTVKVEVSYNAWIPTDRCMRFSYFLSNDLTIIPSLLSALTVMESNTITVETYFVLVQSLYTKFSDTFDRELNGILQEKYVSTCCWMERYLHMEGGKELITGQTVPDPGVSRERQLYNEAFRRFQDMSLAYFASETQGLAAADMGQALEDIDDRARNVEHYLTDNGFRTSKLADIFLDPTFRRQMTTLVTEATFVYQTLIKLERIVHRIREHSEPFLAAASMNKTIALLTNHSHAKTVKSQLFRKSTYLQLLDVHMTPKCRTFNLTVISNNQVDYLFEMRMLCTLEEVIGADLILLGQVVKNFEINADALVKALELFISKTKMDEDFYSANFMQVDLYFEELSYELIEEQESFVLSSLFSEVGGFLGLLLGASLLTVCELIDYILLRLSTFIRQKNIAACYKVAPKGRTQRVMVQPPKNTNGQMLHYCP